MTTGETYLDHAATSPLRDEVWQAMSAARERADFNPASAHACGRRAHETLERARAELAECLGVPRARLLFTGGGTLSDNLAILGFARAHAGQGVRLLVSACEHKAVLGAARRAAGEGAELCMLPVDASGTLELEALETALSDGSPDLPTLVSVMWANNEVGAVQPIRRVTEIAHEHGARVHTDAVQAFGKLPLDLRKVPVDLLTVTAHKLGGPVGIGALYVREDVTLEPLAYGGSQERSMWPGTQNPVGAAGFAAAATLATRELSTQAPRWCALREALAARLRSEIEGLREHAVEAPCRMPNLLSVGIPGVDQATLLVSLDLEGLSVSSGSACSSGAHEGSHVLAAMGIEQEAAVLRFSFGAKTHEDEVQRAAERVARVIGRLRPAVASSTTAPHSSPAPADRGARRLRR